MATGKLAFKPHLFAHVLSDTEVALIGESDRFALRGEAYALLAPLLDGTRSEDEIVAALDGELSPEMAYLALCRLEGNGYIARVPAGGFAAWSAWWLAGGGDADARTQALGQTRVGLHVVGLDDSLAESLADKLRPSLDLIGQVAAADLEVCFVDDYLRPELTDRVAEALASGRPLLPVRPAGLQIWLGPYCGPANPVDWSNFMARLRFNRPADVAVLSNGHDFPVLPVTAPPEAQEAGLSFAALAIVRCAGGDIPAALDGAVWTIDTGSLETRSHRLPPGRPPTVGASGQINAATRAIELKENPKRYTADGGHRVCTPEETLRRLEPLVSPVTGIIPDIERLDTTSGIHVFGALHNNPGNRLSAGQNRLLGSPSNATGKGQTEIQARVSCLAEAVERYSCGFFGYEPRRAARMQELGAAAVHPHDILLYSEHQYDNRQSINEAYGPGFNWIPERFDSDRKIDWTAVRSFVDGRARWVPSTICYFRHAAAAAKEVPVFARGDSNGCASGNTLEEAILQGLFELIERDSCALWWYNRVQRPAIDLASFGEPYFDAMVGHYRSQGRALHVLDLRTDLGIPAAMAASWREDEGDRIYLGLGCHLEPRMAVSRALSEHNQLWASKTIWPEPEKPGEKPRDSKADNPVHVRWMQEATIANQPYVMPLRGERVRAGDMENDASPDIAADIRTCVNRLDALGHETLVLDLTRADVGFPTARVIVPGLRHFWARLAPGRLYDVPVSLGWLEKARREEDLNPIPFFM